MTAPVVDPASGRPVDGGAGLDHLALLAALQAQFSTGVALADPSAPVPACGGWTVRDLVEHLGTIHHWAAAQARRRQETSLGDGPFDLAPFYAEQAAELRTTLAELGPQADSWTLLGDGPASFWWRRQVHETLVHLHDLRAAMLGSATAVADDDPIDVGAEVWADGVEEIVAMFQPRQVRLGRAQPLVRTVRLVATDIGRSWVLGAAEDARPAEEPGATVRGTARGLDLVLWRRLTPVEAGVVVEGDVATFDAASSAPIVP